MSVQRCNWATSDDLLVRYHDHEWGKPNHDDRRHFEHLCLEIMQSGLSWLTVLRKRQSFANAFMQYDLQKIAVMTELDVETLMLDESIIRNKRKIEAIIYNARVVRDMQEKGFRLSVFFWSYVNGVPLKNKWLNQEQLPAKSDLSEQIAKDMRKNGFKFVGPTNIYAHLQSMGIINDHLQSCFRYNQV